jgi:hypothetical protein
MQGSTSFLKKRSKNFWPFEGACSPADGFFVRFLRFVFKYLYAFGVTANRAFSGARPRCRGALACQAPWQLRPK